MKTIYRLETVETRGYLRVCGIEVVIERISALKIEDFQVGTTMISKQSERGEETGCCRRRRRIGRSNSAGKMGNQEDSWTRAEDSLAAGQPASPRTISRRTPNRLKFLAPVCPSSSLSAIAAASRAVGPRIWHPTNGTPVADFLFVSSLPASSALAEFSLASCPFLPPLRDLCYFYGQRGRKREGEIVLRFIPKNHR